MVEISIGLYRDYSEITTNNDVSLETKKLNDELILPTHIYICITRIPAVN